VKVDVDVEEAQRREEESLEGELHGAVTARPPEASIPVRGSRRFGR